MSGADGRGGDRSATVFLSAGESSGDLHGAELARELKTRRPGLRLVGLGGSRMREAGVELLADLDTLAVMGFAEVLAKLPKLLALRWRVRRFLDREDVDLLVPIDYPGFNLSLSCHAREEGIAVLYYIAPQVWAWHASRARKLAECTDRVCVVLPFEEEFLRSQGADARFVGHPLLDREGEDGSRSGADGGTADAGPEPVARSGAEATGSPGPVLGLFPGSREQEVERMLGPFLGAARALRESSRGLSVQVARAPDLSRDLFPPEDEVTVRPPDEVVGAADAAITKSGTITLQLALAGVPMVVGYRTSPVTYWLARRLVEVEHIALANLVAGRRLVPEVLQADVTPSRLAELAEPLLDETSPERRRIVTGLQEVRERLGRPGCAGRVAEEALALLERSGVEG